MANNVHFTGLPPDLQSPPLPDHTPFRGDTTPPFHSAFNDDPPTGLHFCPPWEWEEKSTDPSLSIPIPGLVDLPLPSSQAEPAVSPAYALSSPAFSSPIPPVTSSCSPPAGNQFFFFYRHTPQSSSLLPLRLPISSSTEPPSAAPLRGAASSTIPSFSSTDHSRISAGAGAPQSFSLPSSPAIASKKRKGCSVTEEDRIQMDIFRKLYPTRSLIGFISNGKVYEGTVQSLALNKNGNSKVTILRNKKERVIKLDRLKCPIFYEGDVCMVLHPEKRKYVVATFQKASEDKKFFDFIENHTQQPFSFYTHGPRVIEQPLFLRRFPLKRGPHFPSNQTSDVDRNLKEVADVLESNLPISVDRRGTLNAAPSVVNLDPSEASGQ